MTDRSLRFDEDGAQHYASALTKCDMQRLETLFQMCLPEAGAGKRLYRSPELSPLLDNSSTLLSIARKHLKSRGPPRAVRAILFDKGPGNNWALGWHQDRTIAVMSRVDATGFNRWSRKNGVDHVEPPYQLLASMVTLRAHLDPCGGENAPLLIAPGSHRLGVISSTGISKIPEGLGSFSCHAAAGDVWAYSTPIVHSSRASEKPQRRRVLQVDFADACLPDNLQWMGV